MHKKILLAASANQLYILDAYAFLRSKFKRSQNFILMYHRVSPKQDNWSLEPISPQNFEMQIKYFNDNYNIIALEDFAYIIKSGKLLPKKAIAITFDDGYKDNYQYAYPILKKYHLPATIFLATGYIGTSNLFWWDKVSYIIQNTKMNSISLNEFKPYSLRFDPDRNKSSSKIIKKLKELPDKEKNDIIEKLANALGVETPQNLGKGLLLSWDEIIEMGNNGISFGAHTVNHPILTNLPLEQVKFEITQSKNMIEKITGKKVIAFSYPNGDFGDYNDDIIELVKKSGFAFAVSVAPGRLINNNEKIYELSRLSMFDDFNISKIIICGLWGDLRSIIKRVGNYYD